MFSPQQITQFKKICLSFGVNLSDDMIGRFQDYTNLLLDWNQRIHLVSKGDARTDRIIRHFVDSLTIFKAIDIPSGANILDLGSGAGFPGMPIRIVRDDVKMTLVESTHKKTLFLEKLSELLDLQKISILDERAEQLTDQADFLEKFDLVTAKAVGKLKDIVSLGMPFLKAGGLLGAYKGKGRKREIEEIDLLEECQVRYVVEIRIPELDIFRWFVVMKKMR